MEPQDAAGFSGMHFSMILIWLIVVVVMMIPYVKIIKKAGYSGWWVLTVIIPLVNIVMLWVFAFADWPALGRGSARDF